jgi:hypothetical protein
MKRVIVEGSASKEFASSEEKLVIALMSMGCPPVRIEAEGVICTYYFDYDKAIDIADMVSCGNVDELVIPIIDLWAAQNIWKINLSRARQGQ